MSQLQHQGRIDDDYPTNRSPSPKKRTTTNVLGLGLPPPTVTTSVLGTYPHLGHYIYNLLQSVASSPPRGAVGLGTHPLSVSSSEESDGSDEELGGGGQKTPKKRITEDGKSGPGDREGLVRDIVELLDNEEEEQVKERLRPYMGDLAKVSCIIHAFGIRQLTVCIGRDTYGSSLLGLHASTTR
jgi:hypothetical protein